MAKFVVGLLLAAVLMAGAFTSGREYERLAISVSIANGNEEIKKALHGLEVGSAEFVSVLKKLGKEPQRESAAAQDEIKTVNDTPPPVVAPDDPCKPVPAHCLRRTPPGSSTARRTASH